MAKYKGISFLRYEYDKSLRLDDMALVKNDIYNHIFTRKGERVRMPWFGTGIQDILFEPMDEITIGQVQRELEEVFRFDPRVELIELNLYPFYETSTLLATSVLRYVELDLQDRFDINIQFKG